MCTAGCSLTAFSWTPARWSCSGVPPLIASIYYRGPHLESALTPSLRRRLCEISASLLMPISACTRTSNRLSPAALLFCIASNDKFHHLCFRRWSSPLCCPGWITVMLRWLAYRPICLIVSSLCSTASARLVAGLRRSDHITDTLASFHWLRAPERINFKTGSHCLPRNAHISTEVFTATVYVF